MPFQSKRSAFGVLVSLCLSLASQAQWAPANPVKDVQQQPDGVQVTMGTGTLKLQICTDAIIHVLYSPTASFPNPKDYVVTKSEWPGAKFTMQSAADKTSPFRPRASGLSSPRSTEPSSIGTFKANNCVQEGSRKLTPVKVNGEDTYRAESFINIYGSREGLYGLGQHQAGVWNYRGESVDISQDNTNIAVPLLVSSNGYGIFWNNDSRSRFNNRFANYLYISSEVADTIDYYFFYGPDLDKIIAAYRELTGQAPMFGKWAYGFWQCKNRYQSQEEILGVAQKYRELHIPVDNIVQDWFWWNRKGEHVFNKNYPDPKGMVDELHNENFHLMISVWPFFEPGSPVYDDMDKHGWFVDKFKFAKPPYHTDAMAVYDATNPEARKYYWHLMDQGAVQDRRRCLVAGYNRTGNRRPGRKHPAQPQTRHRQRRPLCECLSADDYGRGLRRTAQRRQTRSACSFFRVRPLPESQRNAVTAWSGDVNSDFLSFRRQIPAGLNFALSGIPYWTTDIGGFVSADPDDPAYRELFVRWFQFGTFSPIFRVHGTRTTDQNELWSYGPEAQKILMNYDRLRYRLLPYIYSLAWKTTNESYTPMRPLVMDFRTDVARRTSAISSCSGRRSWSIR